MSSSDPTGRLEALAPYVRSILRIVAGFLFLQFGTAKLFAWPGAMLPDGGTFPLMTQTGIAGLLESVGGPLMLVGLFTRPVAFILCGEMAFAYFIGHFPQGFWPIMNQGVDAVLYCFIFLYIATRGPGVWSIDSIGTATH